MMNEWSNMSNNEIRMKMNSMEMEYEAIKNKISDLVSKLDSLDIEYNKARKEIEKRAKK